MPDRWHGGSKKGRVVDALAWTGDEGRAKLRKAVGSCTKVLIRGSPNGKTQLVEDQLSYAEYIGVRGQPGELKHLSTRRKRKQ